MRRGAAPQTGTAPPAVRTWALLVHSYAATVATRIPTVEDGRKDRRAPLRRIVLVAVVGRQEDVIFDLEVGRRERAGEVEIEVHVGESAREPSTGIDTDEGRCTRLRVDEHGSIDSRAVWLALVDAMRAESRASEHDRQERRRSKAYEGTSLQLILLDGHIWAVECREVVSRREVAQPTGGA